MYLFSTGSALSTYPLVDERVTASISALTKLERLRHFRDGWAYGEGLAFPERVYWSARLLLTLANGTADVFPGRHGQLTVTFYRDDESYDFIIDEKSVRVVRESKDGGDESEISIADAMSNLQLGHQIPIASTCQVIARDSARTLIGHTKWNSCEFSTPTNTSLKRSDFGAPPSNHMLIWGTSPSLKKTAQWLPRVASVGM